MLIKTIAAATASALLAGGAVAYSDTTKPHPPQTQGQRHEARQAERADRQTALAKDLGVGVEQLKAADAALLKRRLDVRVAKGTLTVAQRSAILACRAAPLTCDRTNLPVRKHRKHQGGTKRLERRAGDLANQLHLDRAKVLSALREQRKRG